jgi:hypothetical protein
MAPEFGRRLAEQRRRIGLGIGGVGYSLERGPSKGLPPGWILPFRLPALPLVPHSLSNWS